MKTSVLFFILLSLFAESNEKTRQLDHNGSKVKTTFEIDEKFLGRYEGSKLGFLQLDNNGNGIYRSPFYLAGENRRVVRFVSNAGLVCFQSNKLYLVADYLAFVALTVRN